MGSPRTLSMKKSSAFCPAYLTGIFTIGKGDAAGAGFAIDRRMATEVSERKSGSTRITINGKEASAVVSKSVLRQYAARCGKIGLLEIKHATDVPIGYGLGMSAAGALSLSLALNEFLGAGFSRQECVKIAHDAEVECGTGLSGVDAASVGGILAKKDLNSAPAKLPFEERSLELAFFSPIRTASVIRDGAWKEKVNRAGKHALTMLFREKNWDCFVFASRQFAAESGLAHWCGGEMEGNPRASMAMLGRTLFSDSPLKLSRKALVRLEAKTCEEGAVLSR
jgi:pantoate kinase